MSKTIILTVEGLFGADSYKGPIKLTVPSIKAATDLMRILERCTALEEDHFPDGIEGGYRESPVIHLHPVGAMGVKQVNLIPLPDKPKPKATAAKRLPAPTTPILLGYGD